jgi:uncharacterized protein
MTGPPVSLSVSAQTARRFVLGKQGLWPGRRWKGKAGTRAAMIASEHLQLDPLVIVARSHDLALHSRVVGYRPEFFDALTYRDRLFFDWGGWLAVRPMTELPYWRALMHRSRERTRMLQIASDHGAALDSIRDLLHERGTLRTRDFKASDRVAVDYSYRGGKDSSLALYYLWLTGEAMTHHRDGFERVYAPATAVAPAHLLEPAADDETDRFIARKAVAFAGIGTPAPLSRQLVRSVSRADAVAIERALLESGDLAVVDVDGWPGRRFVVGADVGILDEIARGRVPRAWRPIDTTTDDEVGLLSPLDPALERRRARELFGFDYLWEIYKKPEHVLFGRYTMPILFGDRFVGRTDLRTDRKSSTLVVNGVWTEGTAIARSVEFRDALRAGLGRLMGLVQTENIDAGAVDDARIRRAVAKLPPR